MSEFDFEDRPGISIGALIMNGLTVVVLLATLCLGGVFFILLVNPQSNLNFFPPTPLPTRVSTFTPSPPAAQQLAATWTPPPSTPTPEPTVTRTPEPSRTPTPTRTPFILISQTPVAVTEESESEFPFVLREGSPLAIQNFVHADQGCDWMGIAGQVFDMSAAPVTQGLMIEVGGFLPDSDVTLPQISLTGLAPQYGPGGYEFELADEPIASQNSLYIQLLDQAGLPLSEQIFFDTFAACERNLILINFQQVRQY